MAGSAVAQAVISGIEATLSALALVAPAAARAITGGQTVEEAVSAARVAAEGVPVTIGPGGAWEADDAAQDARIRESEET